MSELSKCGKDGCNPVEQYRGQMQPQDYHSQQHRYRAAVSFYEDHGVKVDVEGFRQAAFEIENLGAEHAHDMRISCSKCGKSIGWDRVDIETFERHGDGDRRRVTVTRDGNKDKIRQRWNDLHPLRS